MGLTLSGPDTVPPGGSAQFSAIQHYSDGSTRDASAEAAWKSSDESVLSLSSAGLATGLNRGEVSITVSVDGSTATKNTVMVIPPGTFKLDGYVSDAGFAVHGARVTVTDGEGAGQTTISTEGTFRLYGVAGLIEVRAGAPGYADATQRIAVSKHEWVNLNVTPLTMREQLAGRFRLTITAARACAALLPAETRLRTYTAVVTQDGPGLRVKLEGARFLSDASGTHDTFAGLVQPSRVVFNLAEPFYYSYELPDVVEQLTTYTSHYLSIAGIAVTAGSSRGRSGTLNGRLIAWNQAYLRVATCESSEHGFVLSR